MRRIHHGRPNKRALRVLERHSVPLFSRLWFTWVTSCFIEGFGAFQRSASHDDIQMSYNHIFGLPHLLTPSQNPLNCQREGGANGEAKTLKRNCIEYKNPALDWSTDWVVDYRTSQVLVRLLKVATTHGPDGLRQHTNIIIAFFCTKTVEMPVC